MKQSKKVKITFELPEGLRAKFNRKVKRHGKNGAEVLRAFVRAYAR